jgi:hypothetical protein
MASSRLVPVKPAVVILALAALAAGFGLGRATAPSRDAELSSAVSLRWGLEDRDWLTRTWRISSFLQQLGPENLASALEILQPHIPWLVTDEIRLLMFAWARFDPPAALAPALTWPVPQRRNAAGAAMYAWAFRDPEAALDALEEIDEPELVEFMRSRLIEGWAHGPDKQRLSDYLASLPEGPARLTYVGKLSWELVRDGPEAVAQWAEDVPAADAGYKADVFAQAASTLAALDPSGTATWLERHLERGYAARAVRVLVRTWAGADAPTALAWIARRPDDELRRSAVFEAFGVWLDHSPQEAERWLEASTPARVFDPAIRALVARRRRDEPAVALGWALRLSDSGLRQEVATDVGREWVERDPEAARTWLAGGDLPVSLRQAILASAPAL